MRGRNVILIILDEAAFLPPLIIEKMRDARIGLEKISLTSALEALTINEVKVERVPAKNDREHWKQNAQRHNFKRRK